MSYSHVLDQKQHFYAIKKDLDLVGMNFTPQNILSQRYLGRKGLDDLKYFVRTKTKHKDFAKKQRVLVLKVQA